MKTIFLIDDDSDDREIFQTALSSLNTPTNYIEATDGREALNMIAEANFSPPDLFFVDLNMPKIGGLDFIIEMKKMPAFKDVDTYVYTTSSSPEDKRKCLAAGAKGFIIKHTSFDELCKELKHMIE